MKLSLKAIAAAAMLAGPAMASAQTYSVFVGYADGLRSGGFFPNPWFGDAGVQFFFGFTGSDPDAGAIMFQNTGTTTLDIQGLVYSLAGDGGYSYDFAGDIGAGVELDPGKYAIFTGLDNVGDFDTSDFAVGPCGDPNPNAPHLAVTIGTTTTGFDDTGHILDTGGQDQANCGIGSPPDFNESFGWRTVGGAGTDDRDNMVTPEPSTVVLTASGLGFIGGMVRRRRRAA